MEALGIAASLIAVIQLAGQVTSLSYGYISKARQAQKEIEGFVEELKTLENLLKLMATYVQKGLAAPEVLQALDEPLRLCTLELKNLESKLIKPEKEPKKKTVLTSIKKRMRFTSSSLAWPLKRGEVTDIITKIDRNKASFHLALGLDNMYVLISVLLINLKNLADASG